MLLTLTDTLIIPDITKTESNNCFIIQSSEENNDKHTTNNNNNNLFNYSALFN